MTYAYYAVAGQGCDIATMGHNQGCDRNRRVMVYVKIGLGSYYPGFVSQLVLAKQWIEVEMFFDTIGQTIQQRFSVFSIIGDTGRKRF